jgi:trimethylamine--corrinoid protein Co-methyltransferase
MAQVHPNQSSLDSVHFSRLSQDQARQIHWASLEILERFGARLHLPEAVEILKKGGAQVGEEGLVRIPSGMVEKAFTTVPKRVTLYDRQGQPALRLEGQRCFYGPGSDTLNIIDHRTGERRKPLLEDVRQGAILCDGLENIDFVMSMMLPSDVNQAIADTYQMEAMLTHTTKPILTVSYELQGLLDAVEMAEIVMGGEDALCSAPMVTCYINVVSGLNHNKEALQKLLYLSGKGLPAMYIPSSVGGLNSPIMPAGAAALDNAGVLLGLVLSQLRREGAPYIMPGMPPTPMDMRTMIVPYADPERGVLTSLARLYGLPAFGLGGVSDAKLVDQQAAAEAALTLLAETLVGGNIIHDLGYLESGLTFSFAQLVICEEMVGWIEAFTRGVDVNPETLSLDLIGQMGPDGQYLDSQQTYRHFRDIYYPRLFERQDYDRWLASGGQTLGERAAERAETIIQNHTPEPLPADLQDRLHAIVLRREAGDREPGDS